MSRLHLWYELWTGSENDVKELPTLIFIKPTEFDTSMLWYLLSATNSTEFVTPVRTLFYFIFTLILYLLSFLLGFRVRVSMISYVIVPNSHTMWLNITHQSQSHTVTWSCIIMEQGKRTERKGWFRTIDILMNGLLKIIILCLLSWIL